MAAFASWSELLPSYSARPLTAPSFPKLGRAASR
jgi:hypothetical protein